MIFDKYKDQYTPQIWAYALSIYAHQRIIEHFQKRHFDLASSIKDDWNEIWRSISYNHIELTDNQIEAQLEFMGYKKDLKTNDLYAYVSSNRKINGHWFILDKRFVDNLNSINKRPSYPYIYNEWDEYTLEGYTKILTHGTKP